MEPFIGQIQAVGFNFAPRGWALCDGQLLPINSNQALFSLLGTTYGGDGRTTFALPDLRGRSIVHPGTGPGLAPIQQGQRGGIENTTLIANNIPPLPVGVNLGGGVGNESIGTGKYLAFNALGETIYTATAPNGASLNAGTATAGGAQQSFSNRPPHLAVYICIALTGIFPSRN